MRIATWNLNNRVGKVRFRPEAADAAMLLGADVVVLNEYYPGASEATFIRTFQEKRWFHLQTAVDPLERANRVLIASTHPLHLLPLSAPTFDRQFPSNLLAVTIPDTGFSILGVRIPWYTGKDSGLVFEAWNWLESVAGSLLDQRAIILGDLNVEMKSPRSRGGDHFRRMLSSGWQRAAPATGASYCGRGGRQSEIDHILGSRSCRFSGAEYVTKVGAYDLTGSRDAISDHAALVAELSM